eukprot:365522-Chlamydomonas_euryale.AAC.21
MEKVLLGLWLVASGAAICHSPHCPFLSATHCMHVASSSLCSPHAYPPVLHALNLQLLEAYGSLLAETGDSEQAESTLRRCVELRPDVGHEKYMYLGQLLDGEEALAMTKRGIELLQVGTVKCSVKAQWRTGRVPCWLGV